MAERVQLSRKKGFRLPPNTRVVARPSKWGNPFKIGTHTAIAEGINGWSGPTIRTVEEAVAAYREWMSPHADLVRADLAGKNLACWCPLDKPCHADVLLELANLPAADAAQGQPTDKDRDA